ncbi:polymerase [Acidithiobacillus thiooxidans]|uniref:Polymerase n=1 Tax=Acidithiobacillus thiooxidans TaxID=930 RepID=A0A1C2J7G1_ACITH|nr:O-antigen ligase family protein [Acidithiobacillus thiooxidans]OCX69302.1 polymerase [Acidithiobacillus thiooxidans]OCX69556.1 polymerase [Acidithiobacillus thiooxidans]OCX84177.1 polymerase [Acidithiobacillus thiooxidans]OCX86919.1 polymerase [Acidithiobacillus thiooxidans]OFC47969.1 polymerase [Acidithiobacillus thiooxidans]
MNTALKQNPSERLSWFYAVPPFMAYLLAWYYNGQIIPLLAACTLVLLAWGVWVWWPRLRAGLPWPKGFLPVFMPLWFLWFGVTLFWSGVPYSSWFYFWTLGSLPLAFSIWVTMPDAVQERAWKWFWRGAVVSAWVLSGMALWQTYSGMQHGVDSFVLRSLGPLMDTNSFAAWLNLLFFPIVAVYFVRDSKRLDGFLTRRVDFPSLFYLLTLTLLLLAFFSTYSRGGFLAWICTLPFLIIGLRKTRNFLSRLMLLFGLALTAFILYSFLHNFSMFPHLSPHYIASNAATVSRALMWIATWHIFLSHPWLGTGLGSYFLYYPAYRLPDELASAGTYAHNDYIEYLAEGGLINLGFLLAFAGTLMYALYKLLYKAGKSLNLPEDRRLEALGLVLGVFAITGHALGNFIFYNLPLSLLAGLFLARAWRIYGYHGETAPLLPRIGINHGFIAQGVLLVSVVVASWNLLADGATYALFSDNGWLNRMIPNNNQRAIFLMKAANWITVARPLATQPHVYLANEYLTLADQDKALGVDRRRVLIKSALQQYEQGLVGIPRQSGVLSSIGDIYHSQGAILGLDKAQAKRKALLAWRQGLAINPESVGLRNQIAQLADVQAGHVQAGVDFLRAGLKRPLFPYPRSNLQLEIALTQWRAGEHAAAERTLVQLLRENPAYTPAVTWLMSIHRQRVTNRRSKS